MSKPRFPVIEIDSDKCKTPFDCKKCLETCPTSVFMVFAVKVEKGRETNPKELGAYAMAAPMRDKCSVCNDCIEICPEDAIKIYFPSDTK